MSPELQLLITVLTTLAASSGFWAFVQVYTTRKSALTQLILGLAHDRIVHLGMIYVEKGEITKDEYDK